MTSTDIYLNAITLARKNNQTAGPKHDYYVTLQQLETLCESPVERESKEPLVVRHHTCDYPSVLKNLIDGDETTISSLSKLGDPPLMEEEPYDGSLEGEWRKFVCPQCHERVVVSESPVDRAVGERWISAERVREIIDILCYRQVCLAETKLVQQRNELAKIVVDEYQHINPLPSAPIGEKK